MTWVKDEMVTSQSRSIEVVELRPGDPRLSNAWQVMAELRPHVHAHAMEATYAEAHSFGYRITVLLQEGHCRAVAGWRIGVNLHLGRNLYVDDLVTATEARSAG
ncbi:MAG: hypothetical protein M3O70_13825, partial [Actinomycetota bacterium]|nr:hypothetical protein [Actinomycetota bacterium]